MCELCSNATRQSAERRHVFVADELDRLAAQYRALAAGRIKPHTDDAKNVSSTAHLVLRELVADWV
jgi:acyl transferase domain-containing protein